MPLSPEDAGLLEVRDLQRALAGQLAPPNLEVVVVGDFRPRDLEVLPRPLPHPAG